MSAQKLILVRHGETNINVEGRTHVYGDPEGLNEHGRRQIGQVVSHLRKYVLAGVYSSREKRSVQSAEIIAGAFDLPIHVTEGLEERNWGDFAGRPWGEIQSVLDRLTLDERYNYEPPQGESWRDFEHRLIDTIERTLRQNGGTVVLVTHAGAIRALMPYLLGLPKEESFRYDPPNASVTVLEVAERGYVPLAICDTSHLPEAQQPR